MNENIIDIRKNTPYQLTIPTDRQNQTKSHNANYGVSGCIFIPPHNSRAIFPELVAMPDRLLKYIDGHIWATTTAPGHNSDTRG